MKHKISNLAVIVGASLIAVTAAAQETRIQKSDLPAAVQKATESETAGSAIRGYSSEVEEGQQEYEVETVKNGHSRDISFAPDGQVLEVEEQVGLAKLPSKVRAALHAKAGSGNITKVESITKQGKLVAYEAKVQKAGEKHEIQVGPDGESLAHEE
jgi:uncharacterized low-complexity protein